MKRRNALIEPALSALVGLALPIVGLSRLALGDEQAASKTQRTNILMIAVDDLNDWATPTGGSQDVLRDAPELWPLVTPNLSRLATMGVTFENAQCASPACNSSRAALMCSISPAHSGLTNNEGGIYFRRKEPLRYVLTLPQHLKNNGYEIKTSGKIWHNSHADAPTEDPQPEKFQRAFTDWDEFVKIGNRLPAHVRRERPYDVGGIKWAKMLPKGDTTPDALRDGMSDYRTAAWAANEVRKHDGNKPLFVACGIFRPHMPWDVPVQYYEQFPIEKIQTPTHSQDDIRDLATGARRHGSIADHAKILAASPADEPDRVWREAIQAYLAATAFADEAIGLLVDAVEQLNSDANPDNDWTIVLWGDHGWHLGEKERWRKFTLWEEATHSTLLVAAPGVTTPKTRVSVPVDYLDIYPTISQLAGLDMPEHCHGSSFIDLLRNPDARKDNFAVTVIDAFEHSVRSRRYRYIRFADQSEEFYDMQTDPMALVNLADDNRYADEKREHLRALIAYSRRVDSQAFAAGLFASVAAELLDAAR